MGMSDDEKVHAATMGTGIATGIVRPPGEAGQDNADGDGFYTQSPPGAKPRVRILMARTWGADPT